MELWHALLYGAVEGITEFLPVSSTGHLMLVTELLGNAHSGFIKSFEIMIQLGAILAVIFLYPRRLLADKDTFLRVALAFFPTAILGLLFYGFIKNYLLGSVVIVLLSLFIGGILIIFIEWHWKQKRYAPTAPLGKLPLHSAMLLGVLQCIAFIPGVSRSGVTIFAGMFLGLSRKEAVEFSFFLAVPTMGAATALDLFKNYRDFSVGDLHFLFVGFLASFVVAFFAIKWLAGHVSTHDFTWFGIYRIAVALVGFFVFIY